MINIKPKSIILTVGHRGCGKTSFVEKVLIPRFLFYSSGTTSVKYISSEIIKRDLFKGFNYGGAVSKYYGHEVMHEIYRQIEIYSTFPAGIDYIIIDSNSTNKDFIEDIKKIARDNNYTFYLVYFDYKDYGFLKSDKITPSSIKKFKSSTNFISQKNYPNLITLFNPIHINDDDGFLPESIKPYELNFYDTLIIGDIHGCYDELINLLMLNGVTFDDNMIMTVPFGMQLVLIGDIIDKTSHEDIEKTINFLHKNIDNFRLIRGNHENLVFKMINSMLKGNDIPSEELLKKSFNTIDLLIQEDKIDLKNKFIDLFNYSVHYLTNPFVNITHAPVKNEYIGRHTAPALKEQMHISYAKQENYSTHDEYIAAIEEQLNFITKDANFGHPYHVFGHISVEKPIVVKNKIFIDTGCAEGNKLSSVLIKTNGQLIFKSVESNHKRPDGKHDCVMLFQDSNREKLKYSSEI